MKKNIRILITKLLSYTIILSISLATVLSTGCFGVLDQIFPGWRDKTGCESLASCFGGLIIRNNPTKVSIDDAGVLILFLLSVAVMYYILFFIKTKYDEST